MNSKRERHLENGQVVLDLSQDDIARELANMEQLLNVLKQNIQGNRRYSREQRKQDCQEIEETFDVAMTAMKQVWLWIEGGGPDVELHVGPEGYQPKCDWN